MADKSEPFLPEKSFFPPRPISRASGQTWAEDSSWELKQKKKNKVFTKNGERFCLFTIFGACQIAKQYAEHEQSVSRTCFVNFTDAGWSPNELQKFANGDKRLLEATLGTQ